MLALLEGPSAIAFVESDGDPVAVAKALADAARTTRILTIRGGVLEGRAIEASDIEELAKLPPVDILRSQVLGTVIGPLTGILAIFTAPLQDLYGLIDARIEQLEAQGGGAVEEERSDEDATPAAEPEPEETSTEEATTTQEEE